MTDTNDTQRTAKDPALQQRQDLEKIKHRIEAGEKWVKKGFNTGDDDRWKQWEKNQDMLRCQWHDDEDDFPGIKPFHVNVAYSIHHTKRPNLYFKNPEITAVPLRPTFQRDEWNQVQLDDNGHPVLADNYHAAKLLGIKLNHELRALKFKHRVKKAVADNLNPYGIGWLKWGYDRHTVADHSNEREHTGNVWCRRVDPRNVVYDYYATEMDDADWIAERIVLSRAEAEAHGLKIPAGHVSVLPEFLKKRHDTTQDGSEIHNDPDAKIVIWEYTDLKHKKIHWVLLECGQDKGPTEVKEPVEWPYPFDECPYVPLVMTPDSDDIIGLSDVEPIQEQIQALNQSRARQVHHVNNYGTGIAREEGVADDNEIAKYKRTPVGWEMVFKPGEMENFQIVSPAQMGADYYNMTELHKEEYRETLGVTSFQQGDPGAASQKATIGAIVQQSANARIDEQRDVIYDFVIENVRRAAALIQHFCPEEDYLNLADDLLDDDFVDTLKSQHGFNPEIPFLRLGRDDIQGEFHFKFRMDDMVVVPKEVQLQALTNMLSAIGLVPEFRAEFTQKKDVSKVLDHMFELSGLDAHRYDFGNKNLLDAEVENEMFLNGLEVPEPSKRDKDAEHIASHMRAMKPLEREMQALTMRAQQIMDVATQLAETDPLAAQEQEPLIQQELDHISEQITTMETTIRRMKLHMQAHDQQQQEKDAPARVRQGTQSANALAQLQAAQGG